jgi:hypothetical protein
MNIMSKNRGFGTFFYSTAAIMVGLGIALNISGSVRIGTLLIVLSIAVAGGTAVTLGHLKMW